MTARARFLAMLAQLQQLWAQLATDPVLLYSLAAAVLLATVSLTSGLARADVLALLNPRILVRVLGAVALAFVLRALAEAWQGEEAPALVVALLPGLHRFPLYLVALAYGPTSGLLSGALFAAFASSTLLPGAPEAVLGLELLVLGWLAIYPSPRATRWAGPLNAALAYLLAWGTAGIALLAFAGATITFGSVVAEHRQLLPGLGVALVLLTLVGPGAYRHAFPRSRIDSQRAGRSMVALELVPAERQRLLPVRTLDTDELAKEPRRERLRPAFVAQGELSVGRQKSTRLRRLSPRALPEDELVR